MELWETESYAHDQATNTYSKEKLKDEVGWEAVLGPDLNITHHKEFGKGR